MCYSRGRGEARGVSKCAIVGGGARGVSKCAIVGGGARREASLSVL